MSEREDPIIGNLERQIEARKKELERLKSSSPRNCFIARKQHDWCHICGKRTNPLVDVSYPENAEHPEVKGSRYIRICVSCTELMTDIGTGASPTLEATTRMFARYND